MKRFIPRPGRRCIPALAALLLSVIAPAVLAAQLTIACGSDDTAFHLCREHAEAWAAATGHAVRVVATPTDVGARLQVYEELLGVGYPRLDVLEIDVIWPAVLAEELVDLAPYLEGAESEFDGALIANNTVGGRLVALPWYLNFGVLYYRKDLLEAAGLAVPQDWDELAETAARLQDAQREAGNGRFWGFVWQGWRYEGLTCNALEWLASWGAGAIVEPDGRISIDNPAAIEALARPTRWLAAISPESVLSFTETESLALFASGDAAFLRHWPGAWAELSADGSELAGKVGIAPLPRGPNGGRSAATLGGWQLAVSRHSRYPDLAADLVRYLTSAEVQRQRALDGALLPTRPAVYADAAVQAALPVARLVAEEQVELVARPSTVTGQVYPQVSATVQNSIFELLVGQGQVEEVVSRLAEALVRLRQPDGRWQGGR